mmetsp:Transcript_23315/g.35063  ORF Transcript_23315/g.35063 Transcript_23315/m.35063 type:complete len:477 (+) Transcript_23315:133-1563(+)|eukprot:CAMPEP_0206397220 /NCGR_PEP_ID=MMETSP0294-20121207/23306_1 /ASSEMBLY_ACC=CAM_ASM_000327 /TAXON_ID=39354 /ORGANISM="Heterosigma akashiwo, Strain CCMP2393" /LENGTH=476 /DNA_ID=CAMNT_0053852211 /DNA_START=1438 /DNA_END=2868 /DNA_ORIENTATION=-
MGPNNKGLFKRFLEFSLSTLFIFQIMLLLGLNAAAFTSLNKVESEDFELSINLEVDGGAVTFNFSAATNTRHHIQEFCAQFVYYMDPVQDISEERLLKCQVDTYMMFWIMNPNAYKLYTVSCQDGRLQQLIFSNPLDQSEQYQEIMHLCNRCSGNTLVGLELQDCIEQQMYSLSNLFEVSVPETGNPTYPDHIVTATSDNVLSIQDEQMLKKNSIISWYKLIQILKENEDSFHPAFETNTPFAHAVIDGLIPDELLRSVVKEINTVTASASYQNNPHLWRSHNNSNSVKKGISDSHQLGGNTRRLIEEMKSRKFLLFLERLTGVSGLIPDPFGYGDGVHIIEKGGYLKVHTDFQFHKPLHLWRRVNVLLYMNEKWQEEWGGELHLYPSQLFEQTAGQANVDFLKSQIKKIVPVFNRMVVFRTTNDSFHGHPDPLACPENETRKSIALYYYSSDIDAGPDLEDISVTRFVTVPQASS